MIRFSCPVCNNDIKVDEALSGEPTRCDCGEMLRVPIVNPFDHANKERAKQHKAANKPRPIEKMRPVPSSIPVQEKINTLIICSTCKKKIALNAESCPRCGAKQTEESRSAGKELVESERQRNFVIELFVGTIFCLCLIGCVAAYFKGSNSSNDVLPKWDMDRLKRDIDEGVRRGDSHVFVPSDGSQPRMVP